MRLPNWYRIEESGVCFYRAWNLETSGLVRHGFSTRIGGTGESPYDTLNLSLVVADSPDSVLANRRVFGEALEIEASRIVVPEQVHDIAVRRVGESDSGSGALDAGSRIPDTDALITNTPNLPLALHFADCVPVFLLDPANKAIGLVHAGWKGTGGRIVKATIDAMSREFNTVPSDLLAAIGPAICRHCYDVGEGVAREFFKAFPHEERVMKQSGSTKWRVDLKTANLIVLTEAGVLDANIALSEECTSCNREEFFSHRRDCVTGRMSAWLSIS